MPATGDHQEAAMSNDRVPRPALAELGPGTGKKARLHRILYQHGLRNGTAMFLPYDQGLEHGPRDFFDNPAAGDPRYIIKLAVEGGFNGVAIQVGTAEKFFWDYAGEVPLLLKLNGRTEIPSAAAPRSPLNASVEDAVRLGADAVGYTLYVGSEQQEADFEAFAQVRRDAHRFGLPLIVWSYPRGKAVDAKGGKNSFYQVDYASRTASELGARAGPGLDPALDAYLGRLAAGLARALGPVLTGLYLHGSATLGGWSAESSDVDLLGVVARPLGRRAKQQVAARLLHPALGCPAERGLELSMVTAAVAA